MSKKTVTKEVFAKDLVKSLFEDGKASRPTLTRVAKMFCADHTDLCQEELNRILTSSSSSINDITRKISAIETYMEVDYNAVFPVLRARKDFWSVYYYQILPMINNLDDTAFFELYRESLTKGRTSLGKSFHSEEKLLGRLVSSKLMKNNLDLLPDLEDYYKSNFISKILPGQNTGWGSYYDNHLVDLAYLATHSEKVREDFERLYLHFMQHSSTQYAWEQRTYVSVLCRALRGYKNKEFRNKLIKQLVLIKMPSLQKRMAREFSRSRRYLAMA